jgi:hypothetical protein
MKKTITALLLASSIMTTQVRAGEVSIAVVGGMVGTMAIVGLVLSTAATFGQSPLKADQYNDAIDAIALDDVAAITPSLGRTIAEYRNANPELLEIDEIEILKAMVDAHNVIALEEE